MGQPCVFPPPSSSCVEGPLQLQLRRVELATWPGAVLSVAVLCCAMTALSMHGPRRPLPA
jgi:hypothetical protein